MAADDAHSIREFKSRSAVKPNRENDHESGRIRRSRMSAHHTYLAPLELARQNSFSVLGVSYMKKSAFPFVCDCESTINRREFLKTAALGSVAAAAAVGSVPRLFAEKATASQPETLVATLYKSLSEEQRKGVCFAFDHPLRQKVDNNW